MHYLKSSYFLHSVCQKTHIFRKWVSEIAEVEPAWLRSQTGQIKCWKSSPPANKAREFTVVNDCFQHESNEKISVFWRTHTLFAVITIIILTSCSNVGYKAVSNLNDINIAAISIFDDNFEKALYKTNIDIYSNNLTGITLIKKVDSSIRVVFMSEMGIKYFDFEFFNNRQKEPIVHYIMKPLNKKLLINMIKKDFGLLFYLPAINKSKVMVNIEDKSKILIKNNKLLYFSDSMGVISIIQKHRVLLPNKTIITLSKTIKSYPDTIDINHGKISLNFVVLKHSSYEK